ncbi:DUF5054 domain-containing protein [Paenibacillus cremeus]|uniref:DUF5054 domain-containing protein n=1 Tax=Paenibacillus cremeus TaxID=2163881 RepID=A0A559K8L6_9BACL|nr:DUF5054 domain-containing protein [Paenibacillus cremeus]TVY08471.1 DUF5054 domain-containing protein [Paenibacillus cremeus]
MSASLEKIYVVFKTHFDIGFTGFASDVVAQYRTEMLKDVIEICDKTSGNAEHEKYVWTMSSWPLLQSIQGSEPQDQEKALEFLRDRQLIWHMLPFTTHTEFCGMEEWIRGMYVSRGLSEQFGYRPKDAKMTDVPGHTWIVPSILKKAGVQFLHLGCNGFSTPPDVPPAFFWEGPDGERLLTFYSKGEYGTGLTPPEDWEFPVWLALTSTSDNHGPHKPSIIDDMKAEIAEKGLKAELHIGSLTDFAEDFLSRNPELPVIRGDLADSWIHGVGTAPREVSRVRELRDRITVAESAMSLDLLGGEKAADASADMGLMKQHIDDSYEHTLLFGEHTWGMDCKTFLFPRKSYDKKAFLKDRQSERYQRMEQSWQEQIDYLNQAERSLEAALEVLGSGVEKQLRVYNYLGWSRDAWVTVAPEDVPAAGGVLVDGESGERLLTVPGEDGGVRVEVKRIPALGYKKLVWAAADAEAAGEASETAGSSTLGASLTEKEAVLENGHLIVRISRETGWITSLYDKRLDKEWVEPHAEGFGRFEYNVYSADDITRYMKKYAYRFHDWGVHDFGKKDYPERQKRESYSTVLKDLRIVREPGSVRVECTAASDLKSVAEYGNAAEIGWSFVLNEQPHVDMEWRLRGKEATPLAESGHILFPLQIENPSYRINKMGSVIDPCTDIVRSSSTLLHCVESFVDVSDGRAGMAVVPLDSPLLFIGRNGMWDFEPDYKPEKPELNFNLFNNWWGTNFPQWVGGELKYRYRLIPHAGDWREGAVWQKAQETVAQPRAMKSDSSRVEAGRLELLPQGLHGLAVTCLKPAEDGDGFILRLRDWLGEAREVSVVFSELVSEVVLTDLLEYDGERLQLMPNARGEGKAVRFQTEAFGIHTLRLRKPSGLHF